MSVPHLHQFLDDFLEHARSSKEAAERPKDPVSMGDISKSTKRHGNQQYSKPNPAVNQTNPALAANQKNLAPPRV